MKPLCKCSFEEEVVSSNHALYIYFCVNNLIPSVFKAVFPSAGIILWLKQGRQERVCRCGGLPPAGS